MTQRVNGEVPEIFNPTEQLQRHFRMAQPLTN
jgi:hypothetical protein